MSDIKPVNFHFNQISSAKSEVTDKKNLRKLSYVCEEVGTNLTLFLWIDPNNDPVSFQFFFYEKVVEWNVGKGVITHLTNRLEGEGMSGKIGFQKGTRTLTPVDDPSILEEAMTILDKSVFPIGIKDIMKSRILQKMM